MSNNQEHDEAQELVRTYFQALNASDTDLAASLYAPDGVFMGHQSPTSVGGVVHGAYEQVFNAISLELNFDFDETSIYEATATLRTSSTGTITLLHDMTVIDATLGRELFVLRRVHDAWRIAVFMFNESA